jgi:TonB family protein
MPAFPDGTNRCDASSYPQSAIDARAQGMTLLSAHFNDNGTVRKTDVVKSSGNADLDNAAIRCATAFRYPVPLLNGKPISFEREMMVNFSLFRTRNTIFLTIIWGEPNSFGQLSQTMQ